MKIFFKGRSRFPTVFALARNMGLALQSGWNQVNDLEARKLLKLHPEAFDQSKKPQSQPPPPPKEREKEQGE